MNKFFMMIGLPGSGKSTIAEMLSKGQNAKIISSDDYRKRLFNDENCQEYNKILFETIENIIIEDLKTKNIIYDATNIDYKKRMELLNKIKNVEKIAVLISTPYKECLKRNLKRERVVPEEVIKKMYYKFYVPQYFEGFDKITIINNSIDDVHNYYKNFDKELEKFNVEHDNPHHSLNVKEHCKKTYTLINKESDYNRIILSKAALLHDVGKKETKVMGESGIAHYYNHENVGAYISLCFIEPFMLEEQKLEIAKLIQWHMLPYSEMSEKTIKKYKKMLGEEFWNKLIELNKADREAH